MLLRFRAQNHLSLREPQELSLVASSLKDTEASLLNQPGLPSGPKVLPVAVIYGANASGKSNVVDALAYMRTAILRSHREGRPGGGVPRKPFALDEACLKGQSSFDADFIVDGVRYHYGFAVRDDAFTAETLHAFPSGRRQVLFERDRQTFTFGRSLKGRNKVISELTRPNSLFVSAAAQNDHEDLLKIVSFFQNVLVHKGAEDPRYYPDPKEDLTRIVSFLSEVGTGVDGYRITETEFKSNVREALLAFTSVIRKDSAGEFPIPDKLPAIQLSHPSVQGHQVYFDLDSESTGTRRLLALLRPAFRVLESGGVLIIDEIDASLHTKACEAVIALFSSPRNVARAQLIATTHDTNLLRSSLLRRDQIWFTEKESSGATHLYPLSDFHTRQGDNIEKGYLQGRYGAIPFSGSSAELVERV
jgi:AAA domain, putative AbiEii toxin, Type IV TA system